MKIEEMRTDIKEARYVRTGKVKAEREKAQRELLKLAAYCPKVSGCSWGHQKSK